MLSFIRQQAKKMALRLLTWQYQKKNIALPEASLLDQQADTLVKEAHRIARERGQNVLGILKELIDGIKKG